MKRVELKIRRLIVNGDFDAEAFSGALREEIANQLRDGKSLQAASYARPGPSAKSSHQVRPPTAQAARLVARRLFK